MVATISKTTSDMDGIPELQQRYSRADFPIHGIISDLDGVAYRDDHAIPSSVQAFRAWHERGVPYAFVTNNSTKSVTGVVPDLVISSLLDLVGGASEESGVA